jgi:hypothetical protein
MAEEAQEKTPKKKKISRMRPQELADEIKNATEKMGGQASRYVRQLLKRKSALDSK